jgi:hypothetical protein
MADALAFSGRVGCADAVGQGWLQEQADLLITGCRHLLALEEEIASHAVCGKEGVKRYIQAWKSQSLGWQVRLNCM